MNIFDNTPATVVSHKGDTVSLKVEKIIKKWYETLEFSKEFDEEFYSYLESIKISDSININTYKPGKNGKRDLLSFLYMCEDLKDKYKEMKIPESILIDTLKDIERWTNTWSDIKGKLYLGECSWLSRHLSMKLFKLGRLQFCMGQAEENIEKFGVLKGDNILEVHIPECGPLLIEECEKSIKMAREFFEEFFPDFKYKCFTCHSWLLDENLKEIIKPESNILKFQSLFEKICDEESDAILKYVFNWNTTRRKLKKEVALSSFANKVKEKALSGGKFYETLGAFK